MDTLEKMDVQVALSVHAATCSALYVLILISHVQELISERASMNALLLVTGVLVGGWSTLIGYRIYRAYTLRKDQING